MKKYLLTVLSIIDLEVANALFKFVFSSKIASYREDMFKKFYLAVNY